MVDQHFMDSQIDAEAAGEVGPAFVVDSGSPHALAGIAEGAMAVFDDISGDS